MTDLRRWLTVGGVLLAAYVLFPRTSHTSATTAPEAYTVTAFTADCQQRITDKLKAPATARFPAPAWSGTEATGYTASGAVDSENSFGALIRAHYECSFNPETKTIRSALTD